MTTDSFESSSGHIQTFQMESFW